jgi:hypothetical protein
VRRRNEELERKRQAQPLFFDQGQLDREVAQVAQRYEKMEDEEDQDEVGFDARAPAAVTAAVQQRLRPSVKDPKLFMVKCNRGKELEALEDLMQRCVAVSRAPLRVAIRPRVVCYAAVSALALPSL